MAPLYISRRSFLLFLLLSPLPLLQSLFFIHNAAAATAPVKALLAPIHLDATTSLYTMTLLPPSPSGSSPLMLDLDNSNLWRDCVDPRPYSSLTFKPLLCNNTAACAAAQSCTSLTCGSADCYGTCTQEDLAFPACSNYTCASWASISAIKWTMACAVWRDTIALPSTDGKTVLSKVTIPDFEFLCTDDTLLKGGEGRLPPGVVGGAGLSKNPIALPSQISAKIPTISRKFAYCLPASADRPGVIFFGDGPYVFLPSVDVSTLLRYTPILSFSKEADSYFIQINSITVNSVSLPIDASLLTITRNRTSRAYVGGTRFSSSEPYTRLAPSIYAALASEFKKAAMARGIKPVAAVSPFDLCFDASTAASTRLGYNVPEIDIVLKGKGKSKTEVWQIFGANSVVEVKSGVFCLAFQKTIEFEERAIIIGTYQQQNAFFQFDLAAKRVGFISSLLGLETTCSNFNFT